MSASSDSTASAPLKPPESITPTEMKTRFLKCDGKDRNTLRMVWMPMPPKFGTRTAAVGARRSAMGIDARSADAPMCFTS